MPMNRFLANAKSFLPLFALLLLAVSPAAAQSPTNSPISKFFPRIFPKPS